MEILISSLFFLAYARFTEHLITIKIQIKWRRQCDLFTDAISHCKRQQQQHTCADQTHISCKFNTHSLATWFCRLWCCCCVWFSFCWLYVCRCLIVMHICAFIHLRKMAINQFPIWPKFKFSYTLFFLHLLHRLAFFWFWIFLVINIKHSVESVQHS